MINTTLPLSTQRCKEWIQTLVVKIILVAEIYLVHLLVDLAYSTAQLLGCSIIKIIHKMLYRHKLNATKEQHLVGEADRLLELRCNCRSILCSKPSLAW